MACELSDFVAAFVPFAFFSAYFLFSIPSGLLIQKIGYKNGIVLGLIICFVGAMLFLPAANTRIYIFFLLALAVLAAGITLLQVAANPYVALLGDPKKASSRISLVGLFNSLGGTISPLIGGIFILSNYSPDASVIKAMSAAERLTFLASEASSVKVPYMILAGCLLSLAILVFFSKMPNIEQHQKNNQTPVSKLNLLENQPLFFGIIAIFVYVGAEVAIADFMIRYGQYLNIPGFTNQMGSLYLTAYGITAMVGRFVGIFALPRFKANQVLIVASSLAVILICLSIFSSGTIALALVALVGLCNSVLWPSIFPLAIEGLGIHTKKGSSYLIMAVAGGAVIPLIFGVLSDNIGVRYAYFVPAFCYLYIIFYGVSGYKSSQSTEAGLV